MREGSLDGDGGASGGGCGVGGAPHGQLARTRLFPLGPAAPIDRMPHVQFRSHNTLKPNHTNHLSNWLSTHFLTFQAKWDDLRLRARLLRPLGGIPEEEKQGESEQDSGGAGVILDMIVIS